MNTPALLTLICIIIGALRRVLFVAVTTPSLGSGPGTAPGPQAWTAPREREQIELLIQESQAEFVTMMMIIMIMVMLVIYSVMVYDWIVMLLSEHSAMAFYK